MLRLEDSWVWDSWIADDGERYHLFFLQAPRALGDPDLRHVHATVGHASSLDLVDWELHGTALGPAQTGFDDLAIWTGSVVRAGGGWWMFYTAISTAGHGVHYQRVGAALSDDLHTWRRVGSAPTLDVDGRWYKTSSVTTAGTGGQSVDLVSETWRDPLVLRDPAGDGWHMLLTARALDAGLHDDGVIAHARSRDLSTWEVGAPRSAPGAGFGQLEVLQSTVVDGRPVLVFTCTPQEMTSERRARSGGCSTWSVPSPGLTGPWDIRAARPFRAEPALAAAPVVQRRDGSSVLLGFRNFEGTREDGFWIGDPIPVGVDAEGCLEAR